jgi:hypothetical protein
MMKNLIRVFLGCLIGISFSAVVPAQQEGWMGDVRDRYVISAKAGGVNFVEGTVTVVANDGSRGRLTKGDHLEPADRITTGSNGKAEILLNPGSYARLGTNSTFEFNTTSLDDLQLKLSGGSAIFEVFASKDFKVTINTPKAKMFLIQSGIYRVDVLEDGGARISVTKGRAQVGDNGPTAQKGDNGPLLVKSRGQATISGSTLQLGKFDSDNKDALDVWSKGRAKDLALFSRKVDEARMRNSLLSSFGAGRWNMFNSFGLWAYNPLWGSYSFLPFGYGWNSPYGYGFGPCIYTYNLPPVVYIPPHSGPQITPIGQNPRGSGSGGGPLETAPPFMQIQSDPKSGGSITNGGGRSIMDTRTDVNPSAPVFSPAPSSVPIFAPSTTRTDSKPKNN